MDSADPRVVIYDFLAELPDMIRTEELFFLLLFCCRKPSLINRQEYLADAEIYLKQHGLAGIDAVRDAMEVIGYRLSKAELLILSFEEHIKGIENPANTVSGEGLSGSPLMRKHYADAHDRWKKLTLSQLSEQSIRAFQEKTSESYDQQTALPYQANRNLLTKIQSSNPPTGGLLSRCLAYLTRINHQHG
jgi:hypothetical protein